MMPITVSSSTILKWSNTAIASYTIVAVLSPRKQTSHSDAAPPPAAAVLE